MELCLTAIPGNSAFYRDSTAALVIDGEIVDAIQEERFTRIKHDASIPDNAARYCLEEAGLEPRDIDYVCSNEKPLIKFERLLETYFACPPAGLRSFSIACPVWIKEKPFLKRNLRRQLRQDVSAPFVFIDHHESHAASAFFPSRFEQAAILTIDG